MIPTSADGKTNMRTPCATSACIPADGKLHAVTDKDYLCAFTMPASEWAHDNECLQVLVQYLKMRDSALVIYNTQCISITYPLVGGTSARRRMPHLMTIEGTIQDRLDLEQPYNYFHAFDGI